ncbi:MAG: fused MFS/spermidine synthase [Actinomycetota bacterium]|nr:fused MFS/spermidine synthase [Actinomycetota bacterium]
MASRPKATPGSSIRSRGRGRGTGIVALFSATLFVSAGLTFLVQPMFAKFVLPLFGSTPAVWNTTMLFFQTTLLAGYLYAHESTRRLGVRRQTAVHLGILLVPLLVLPIGVSDGWIPPADSNPVPWLLGLLAVAVGLPFFVVTTTAPLLQRWLAATDHPAAADPYFLYRASNLGSVLGLLAYPLVVEPNMRLAEQGRLWSVGYGLLVVLVLACAAVVWRSPRDLDAAVTAPAAGVPPAPPAENPEAAPATDSDADPAAPGDPGSRPTLTRRLRWVGLAFVPSSLMLGVTVAMTTDVAPIPLLWSLPLSLYLISFILVFAPGSRSDGLQRAMVFALPGVVFLISVILLLELRGPLWIMVPVHLAGFFVVAVVCHGALARDRPPTRWLTEFYLLISLGGALGGVFNAIVAPALFDSLAEYPIALVLAALCLPWRPPRIPPGPYARWLDFALPLVLGTMVALMVLLIEQAQADVQPYAKTFAFGLAAGVAVNFIRRPLRFGLSVGAIVLAVALASTPDDQELHRERSFFGVYRVTAEEGGNLHRLVHGTTTHGSQDFSPGRERMPASYYHRGSPIGQLLSSMPPSVTTRAAIIGLGTGSIGCYSEPGERWTFYEIDPTIERIARDPRLFTYLRVCAGDFDVVLGDARLRLPRAADRGYGLIMADAFSSDAVPVHLLTREALALYRSKLREHGIVAFNVSNNYVTLEPVLGNLAHDASMACVAQKDRRGGKDGVPETDSSDWVVMARHRQDLGVAATDPRWHDCRRSPGSAPWTDDYSNLLGALDLNR